MKRTHDHNAILPAMIAKLYNDLGQRHAALQTDAQRFLDAMHIPDVSGLIDLLVSMRGWLEAQFGQFEAFMKRYAEHRNNRAEYLRNVEYSSGNDTPFMPHDWMRTLLITQFLVLVEIIFVGGALISGGHMDVPSALTTAAIFAVTNSITGLMIGYHFVRRAVFKIKAPELSTHDRRIQKWGRIGTFIGLIVLVILIFVAARVRATSSHAAIFDFSIVGFFQTFGDGMVWLIITIAIVSCGAAIHEGYRIDPVMGLADAHHYATDDLNEEVKRFVFRSIDGVLRRVSPLLAQAHNSLAQIDAADRQRASTLTELNAARRTFNHQIEAAKNTIRTRHQNDGKRYEAVKGIALDALPDIDLTAFNTLRLPLLSEADIDHANERTADVAQLRTLVSDIEAKLGDTLGAFEAAHANYRAKQPGLSPVTKPEGV